MLAAHLARIKHQRPVRYSSHNDPAVAQAVRNFLALRTRAQNIPALVEPALNAQGAVYQARPQMLEALHHGLDAHDPASLAAFLDMMEEYTGQHPNLPGEGEIGLASDEPHQRLLDLLGGALRPALDPLGAYPVGHLYAQGRLDSADMQGRIARALVPVTRVHGLLSPRRYPADAMQGITQTAREGYTQGRPLALTQLHDLLGRQRTRGRVQRDEVEHAQGTLAAQLLHSVLPAIEQ